MNELSKPSATCVEFGICTSNLKGRACEREKAPTFESWREHIWDQSSTGERLLCGVLRDQGHIWLETWLEIGRIVSRQRDWPVKLSNSGTKLLMVYV